MKSILIGLMLCTVCETENFKIPEDVTKTSAQQEDITQSTELQENIDDNEGIDGIAKKYNVKRIVTGVIIGGVVIGAAIFVGLLVKEENKTEESSKQSKPNLGTHVPTETLPKTTTPPPHSSTTPSSPQKPSHELVKPLQPSYAGTSQPVRSSFSDTKAANAPVQTPSPEDTTTYNAKYCVAHRIKLHNIANQDVKGIKSIDTILQLMNFIRGLYITNASDYMAYLPCINIFNYHIVNSSGAYNLEYGIPGPGYKLHRQLLFIQCFEIIADPNSANAVNSIYKRLEGFEKYKDQYVLSEQGISADDIPIDQALNLLISKLLIYDHNAKATYVRILRFCFGIEIDDTVEGFYDVYQ